MVEYAHWMKGYVNIQRRYDAQTLEIDAIMKEAKKVADQREKLSKFCHFGEIFDWKWGVCHFHDEDFKDVKEGIHLPEIFLPITGTRMGFFSEC